MSRIHLAVICGAILATACLCVVAGHRRASLDESDLPPLETFVLGPISVDSFSAWVPADRTGPVVNRSCRPRRDCLHSCLLPARVQHEKAEGCPDAIGRLLAEHAAPCHERTLPLTIFNGWQWEYSYSVSQFEAVYYEVAAWGGSWENSLEAILTRSLGTIAGEWVQIPSEGNAPRIARVDPLTSRIEVTTFSSIRTRDDYPKTRRF